MNAKITIPYTENYNDSSDYINNILTTFIKKI